MAYNPGSGTGIRDYPAATTLESSDALILSRVGVGTMQIPGSAFSGGGGGGSNTYDIGMFWPGDFEGAGSLIFKFTCVTPFSLPTDCLGSLANLETSPDGSMQMNVSKYDPNTDSYDYFGYLFFDDGEVVGTFEGSAVSFTAGQRLLIEFSEGPPSNASDLSITFKATKS